MTDTMPITLSKQDTSLFIDLWEKYHCLWDCRDPQYKDRGARQVALSEISEAFGQNWTVAAAERKIKSLKSYYLYWKVERDTAGSTGMPGGKKEVPWQFFDRIHGFLGSTQFDSITVTRSQCPGDSDSGDMDSVPDIVELTRRVHQARGSSLSSSCSTSSTDTPDTSSSHAPTPSTSRSCTPVGLEYTQTSQHSDNIDLAWEEATTPPPSKKPKVVLGSRIKKQAGPANNDFAKTDFYETARIDETWKQQESPDFYFAMDIVENLGHLKSEKKKMQLKHDIQCMIFKACMEETDN